jgi:hypothetical protein
LVALTVLGLYVALLALDGLRRGHIDNGDSALLVHGASEVLSCLRHGVLSSCGLIAGTNQTTVGPYPLIQYLPAVAMTGLEIDDRLVLRGLAGLNLLALVGSMAFTWRTFWRRDDWRWLAPVAIVLIIGGPVSYYATTSFGEMLAASMVLSAVLAAYHHSTTPTFLFSMLATMSREILAPFVLILTTIAAFANNTKAEPGDRWRSVLTGVLGSLAGVVFNLAFNYFRYGSIENVFYLDPTFRVPDSETALSFFAMLNVAPAGGILFFWPLAVVVLTLGLVVAALRILSRPRNLGAWLPMVLLVLTYAGFVGGLSFWVSPFGWIAWGPRLTIPVVPALVVTSLIVLAPLTPRAARWVSDRGIWLPLTIGLMTVALSLPQLAGPWTYPEVIASLTAPDRVCPALTEIVIQEDPELYYRCIPHIAWRLRPSWLDDALSAGGSSAWLARTLGAAAIGALCIAALRRLHVDRGAEPPNGPT